MVLAALVELHVARVGKLRLLDHAVRVGVASQHVRGDVLEPETADRRRRCLEAQVDDLSCDAHRVEDLRAAVRVDAGDAHLGQHLQDALLDGLLVGDEGVRGIGVAGPAPRREARNGGEREARVDGLRAVAQQAREVM